MSDLDSFKHQVRKSRQSGPPVIKFRSSCDLCTEAKVRCDKKHPHCSRCIRIGSECRYSVSMRTGKPAFNIVKAVNTGRLAVQPSRSEKSPSASTDAMTLDELRSNANQYIQTLLQASQNQSADSASKCLTPPASESDNSPAVTAPLQHPITPTELALGQSMPSCSFPMMDMEQYESITNMNSEEKSSSSASQSIKSQGGLFSSAQDSNSSVNSHCPSPDTSISGPLPMDFDYFMPFDIPGIEPSQMTDIFTQTSTSNHAAQDTAMLIDPQLQQPTSAAQNDHICSRKIRLIRRSIAMMTGGDETFHNELCICSSTSPIRTMDQALLMCSNVGQQLLELLGSPCEGGCDPHLPFLITALISKVLATYSAIAKIDVSTRFKFGNSPPSQRSQQPTPQQEKEDAFESVPLQLGAFVVDRELEGVLWAHMVLHELSKLECIGQLFEEKYCQEEGNSEGNGGDSMIYSALNQFIRVRYTATKKACENRSTSGRV
ncbi:hypothetical protein F5Y06DRAFT_270037 [Hypoxylon sp. FL0890]|nr:hypothetical protein F5Y06DRAFT_270037 [Hypoxylon sp. FL0890]